MGGSEASTAPTLQRVYAALGPTPVRQPEPGADSFALLYPGCLWLFPVPPAGGGGGGGEFPVLSGTLASRLYLFAGSCGAQRC